MTAPRLLFCSLIVLWLAGCAGTPGGGNYENGGSPLNPGIDLSTVPPAVPKDEPLSRYGNPASYSVFGKTYYPMRSASGFTQTGIASWYGRQFQGKLTSSGEPYDMFRMTAAHKTLPLPCYVRVTNLRNGKQVIVRVNDRGPFHTGRIIDLSYVAALKLGMVRHGSAPVRIETITAADVGQPAATPEGQPGVAATIAHVRPVSAHASEIDVAPAHDAAPPAAAQQPGLYLQVGAFSRRDNAQRILERLRQLGFNRTLIAHDASLYRVRVGPFASADARLTARQRLSSHHIPAIPVR